MLVSTMRPDPDFWRGKRVLLTGHTGFKGAWLALWLQRLGAQVTGVALPPATEPNLFTLAQLGQAGAGIESHFCDIRDAQALAPRVRAAQPEVVLHLAAQAGVRYSLEQPFQYADSNLAGFLSILEACRHHAVEHLVYASSSSVYGGNAKVPFSEHDNVDHPVSLYAATKKANELMAHTYSHLFGIPTTGLRFFTVYGPWGRPDMSPMLFASALLEGRPLRVFNHGDMKRDFTYVDDIVEGVLRVLDKPATPVAEGGAPHRVFNIGNHDPVPLLDFIACIERATGRTASKRLLPMQPGDVPQTWADVSASACLLDRPTIWLVLRAATCEFVRLAILSVDSAAS